MVNEVLYGIEIYIGVVGIIYDYLINYKVDLDIGGRKIFFENIDIKVENIFNFWFLGFRRI